MNPRILVMIGATVVVVAFFLTWVHVSSSDFGISESGSGWRIATENPGSQKDAFIVLGSAIAAIFVGYLSGVNRMESRTPGFLTIGLAVLGLVFFWTNYSQIKNGGEVAGSVAGFDVTVSMGIGAWLTILGNLVVAGGGLLGLRELADEPALSASPGSTAFAARPMASDNPSLPPQGAWVSPANGVIISGPQLRLAARAHPYRAGDPAIDNVSFVLMQQASWSVVCVSRAPNQSGEFDCTADLNSLGAAYGPLEFRFEVYNRAGRRSIAPDGTRTVMYGEPKTLQEEL